MIGLILTEEPDEHRKQFIAEKRAELEAKSKMPPTDNECSGDFPPEAQLCQKCMAKAVVKMDGCMTCLSCADSKCG
jgi:hypothetical protein